MSKHVRHKAAAHKCGFIKGRKRNPEEEPPEAYCAYFKLIYVPHCTPLAELASSPLKCKLN